MKHLRLGLALVCVLALAWRATAAPSISEGLASIRSSGNPASLIVWGDATPLIVRDDGRVMAASGTLGEGRVVALGHGGYFESDHLDTHRLIQRSTAWLHTKPGIARVQGVTDAQFVLLGADKARDGRSIADVDLDEVSVVIGSPQAWARAGRLEDLRTFVEEGGGLLAMECAWGQLQLGRAASLEELAVNRLLAEAGIMYTDRAEPSESAHAPALRPHANATDALEALATRERPAFSAGVVGEALRIAPMTSAIMEQARAMRTEHGASIDGAYAAMSETPITPASHPLAFALLAYDGRTWTPEDGAHPSHVAFPGPHDPDAEPAMHDIAVDPNVRGWQSTGLWAPAGTTVALLSGMQDPDPGILLRVGSWLDPQDFNARVRMPDASLTSRLTDERINPSARVFTPIGGPVYVQVVEDHDSISPIRMRVNNAFPMPRFVLGETTLEEWNAMRADPSAPWCELESEHLVFTLPMDRVQGCERPDLVMEHWDRVHEAMHRLQPRSPNHWPDGKYRFVAEKRLSWGYMYCPQNAPAVIPMTAADEMVDLAEFDDEGPHQLWGHYHEMGHAHQSAPWTFDGTVEVTVNIFTVYALHTVNGYPLDSEHLRTSPEEAWRRFEAHKAEGAPFDTWKRDPFLALQTYAMLWHEFGFEMYERVFENYREAGFAASRMSEQEKIDRWVIECSFATQRNLASYFRAWGLPVSDEPGRIIPAVYPDWMPTAPE